MVAGIMTFLFALMLMALFTTAFPLISQLRCIARGCALTRKKFREPLRGVV